MRKFFWTLAVCLFSASAWSATNAEDASGSQLYMAGDSIMTEYTPDWFPQYGWGQSLKSFMKKPENLHNFARSGWSARRFRESGRWEKCIASALKPGDWVIVSFGHNDMNKRRNKPPKNDYSTVDEYKAFLKGFAADARAKGANIAFATSIAHSSGFREKDGAMSVDGGAMGLGPYVAAMRETAAELGVPLLDLNRYAEKKLPKMGLEKAKALYMYVKPGEYANYPKGKQDAAHVRDSGAYFYARGAVEMAREQGLSLADLWKDPSNVQFMPSVLASNATLRVGTYNIRVAGHGADKGTPNAWGARKKDMVDLIRRLELDVFGAQEVRRDQARYIRKQLPGFAYVGDFRNKDRVHGEASPVFYRQDRLEVEKTGTFWLSKTPDVPGSKGWDAQFPRICTWVILHDKRTGKRFCFANTHPEAKGAVARRKGMALIVKRMKEFGEGLPIVFTGDHNSSEDEAPALAVKAFLKDALYESKTPPAGPWRTYTRRCWREREVSAVEALKFPREYRNPPRVGSPNDGKVDVKMYCGQPYCGPRIDFIYVSPGVKVKSYATHADPRPGMEYYPSDHFPVTAEIEL